MRCTPSGHGCWDQRTARSREGPGSGGTGSWSTAPTPAAGCRWSSTRSARGSWPAPALPHPRGRVQLRARGPAGGAAGRQEVVAGPGDLVFKPRGQWHTFWNPGEEPTRILELITPAGLEDLFRELGTLGDDFEGTAAVIERHGLRF
ncbi:MAG TPA: cupin domain-containing protein [Actinomycetota bacterium]|nr:cupin domain-containing protein [Actinomycetota bacterium]